MVLGCVPFLVSTRVGMLPIEASRHVLAELAGLGAVLAAGGLVGVVL